MFAMALAMLLASGTAGEVGSRHTRRLVLTAMMLCLFAGMIAAERQPLAQEVPQNPNVLFILTDDQDEESAARMDNVQTLLAEEGTTFSNAFATTPVCCPSRVSFMRGQYTHNHGVLTNNPPTGGYNRFIELGLQDSTIATWLHDAGYSTFYAGKFLNGYGSGNTDVAPGWDEWYAFAGGVKQRKYTVNENGTLSTYRQRRTHETYYLRDRAESFIRDNSQGSAPWFAWISTHAPHGPHTIAPEFLNSYDDVEMPTPPSYNEADVSDKPGWVQELPLLDDDCSTDEGRHDCHQQVIEEWRARQEALMSVDVMVEDLVSALAETNQLERTYIVFASDNGYSLYRHRVYAKGVAYEESWGIPFVVRGPGVQRSVVSEELVANIDLAPTIAEWAGIESPGYVDGRSLVPLLEGTQTPWREYLLFETWVTRKFSDGVRSAGGETYVEYMATGEREYYDLAADPWQLESAHAAPENAERVSELSGVLPGLRGCAAATCREREDAP
jgi:N-acetylglucosamine-6-sulfatase